MTLILETKEVFGCKQVRDRWEMSGWKYNRTELLAYCSSLWPRGRPRWLRWLSSQSLLRQSWPECRALSLWLPPHVSTPREYILGYCPVPWLKRSHFLFEFQRRLLFGTNGGVVMALYLAADFTNVDWVVVTDVTGVWIFVGWVFPRLREWQNIRKLLQFKAVYKSVFLWPTIMPFWW